MQRCLEGKILLAYQKTNSIQLSDTSVTSKGTRFHGQMKQKKSFLAANPDGFGANRDKKYTMPTVKYTAGSLIF